MNTATQTAKKSNASRTVCVLVPVTAEGTGRPCLRVWPVTERGGFAAWLNRTAGFSSLHVVRKVF